MGGERAGLRSAVIKACDTTALWRVPAVGS